jgi:ESCRT-I complex subunit TSG101
LLNGTLPVQFRGETYQFPISLWVPQNYPREGPMVYVTPSQGMVIRPGQHVYNNGRVFHPYLAQWPKMWDVSA